MKTILKKYNALEDKNYHTEAAQLLVNTYGTVEEQDQMDGIAARHEKNGSIDSADYYKRYELSQKYYNLISK